jgi:hypothetical protein
VVRLTGLADSLPKRFRPALPGEIVFCDLCSGLR